MADEVVTVQRVVPATPQAIFDLLADPARHPDIDGSGSVKETRAQPSTRLGPGSVFGMSMKIGVPYKTVNTVIEFEESRRIAWQTTPTGMVGRLSGGRIWRYELEPTEGGTLVRESWDLSQDKQRSVLKHIAATKTKRSMEKTLERIEQLTAGSPAT